jgi:hypothetical protein
MAVNFQRRNVGVLADTPTFEDVGRSAYVDYGAALNAGAMIAQETMAPTEEAAPAAVNPDDYEARARAALAAMEQQAALQKKAAGNPLNVVGSVLGGVVGLPFKLLENAVGGGQNDLTAPFRPKQAAEQRYQSTLAAIGEKRAEFERDLAGARASNAQALKTSLGAGREEDQAGYTQLGNLTSAMLYMTPEAKAERIVSLQAIANRFPNVAPAVREIIDGGFNPAALATYGSLSTDEGARQRANEFLYGTKAMSLGDGAAALVSSRPDVAPQVIVTSAEDPAMRTLRGLPALAGRPSAAAPASAPEPDMRNTPPPEVGPNGLPSYLTKPQYEIIKKSLGPDRTDAWIKKNNIVVEEAPAAPSPDAIDAELRRRGVIK